MTGVQTCALPICFPVTIAGDWEVIPKYCAHEICDSRGLLIATVRNEQDCEFIVQAKKDLQWLARMVMDLEMASRRVPE